MAHARQGGVAILAITVILLIVTTIATLMVARVGLFEQKVVGTDVRSKEVYSVAIGGLEEGVNWIEDNAIGDIWDLTDADACGAGATADAPALEDTVLNTNAYERDVTYVAITCLDPDYDEAPLIIQVISEAKGAEGGDSHVSKTVYVEVMRGRQAGIGGSAPGGPMALNGPPIMTENCMSGNVSASAEVQPNGGIAIGTTSGTVGCLDHDKLDLGGGTKVALNPSSSLWNAIFGPHVTKADLKQLYMADRAKADADEGYQRRIIYVDSSTFDYHKSEGCANGQLSNFSWHCNEGSEDLPVVLFFESATDCPSINGGNTVYGLVYFEKTECDNNGMGNGTVYGTVAKAGDMTKLTGSFTIIGESLEFGGGGDEGQGSGPTGPDDPFEIIRFAEIPGSWADFQP
ncbi:MAG: hypothetical protein VR73_00085 [Gammaproteobacteria bacterium BRH_c0]|nr:MAG: hypothetical protein VR73_00085 [Gammaproteobacteria bacterium BRH_c0]